MSVVHEQLGLNPFDISIFVQQRAPAYEKPTGHQNH